jgi:3-phosphoglycerate kinase
LLENGEAMREQARSAERPSEPQANGLTALLGIFIVDAFGYFDT